MATRPAHRASYLTAMQQGPLTPQGWALQPSDIEICKNADGLEVHLGSGTFGTVCAVGAEMRSLLEVVGVSALHC
jgi:hypothetical protein